MQYDKAKRLLDLAIAMRLSFRGLSLNDIQDRYDVSRRTAERMRNAVWDMFPLEEKKCFSENFKRWKVTQSNIDLFVAKTNQQPDSVT
jgi:predicted DNA-binding transcriptional regulator YafY